MERSKKGNIKKRGEGRVGESCVTQLEKNIVGGVRRGLSQIITDKEGIKFEDLYLGTEKTKKNSQEDIMDRHPSPDRTNSRSDPNHLRHNLRFPSISEEKSPHLHSSRD